MEEVYKELSKALGPDKISTNPIDLFPYSRDWSPMDFDKDYIPDAVCIPTSTKEVSTILKIAEKWRTPVVAWGGGTGMGGDNLAVIGGIVVATRNLEKVLEIDTDNYTITVQAGATIQSINDALEPHGLWFPHDPESKPSSTIGAAIMCDNDGTFGIKYGGMVDYVLNAKVVIPGGNVIRVGHRKASTTSSGYKLLWLLIGSEGTLGIVTEVTIRVFPIPEKREVMLWLIPEINVGIKALYELHRSGLWIESAHINDNFRLDYYTHSYYERTGKHAAIPENFKALLALTVAGDDDVVSFSKDKISKIMANLKCKLWENEDIVRTWWASKHTLQWEKNKWSATQKKEKFGAADVGVPVGNIEKMYDAFKEYTERYNIKKVGTAVYNARPHVSPSISFAVYIDDHDKDSVRNFFKYVEDMAKRSLELEGTMSSYIGDGTRLRKLTPLEHGEGLKLMWAIKKIFDPHNIMNPGKIFPKEYDNIDYEV